MQKKIKLPRLSELETELIVITGGSRSAFIERARYVHSLLNKGTDIPLKDLAGRLAAQNPTDASVRLAVVASSLEDLEKKLGDAITVLTETDQGEIWKLAGIYYGEKNLSGDKKIAFVFPGQGSQYPGMFKDLASHFPSVRDVFKRFDAYLSGRLLRPLTSFIFPPEADSPEVQKENEAALTRTNIAQPAMGAADSAMYRLLGDMGIRPHMTAGHSYGEYAALFAADVINEEALAKISEARGRFILESAHPEPGTMAAVKASETEVSDILSGLPSVWIANLNSPKQTVISGTQEGVAKAMEKFREQSLSAVPIQVACAFHSPIVSGARNKLTSFFRHFEFHSSKCPVFSNTTATIFPGNVKEIQELLGEQLINSVRFVEEIRAMYNAGARIFVEVGAGSVLTNLIGGILGGLDHKTVCTDKKGVAGLTQLHHALGQLTALGVSPDLGALYGIKSVGETASPKTYHIQKPVRPVRHDFGDRMFERFQDLMMQYMETQRTVMRTFLEDERLP